MTMRQMIRGVSKHFIPSILMAAAVLLIAGCGGAGNANDSGNTPVPPAGTQGSKSYTYAGTQSADGYNNFPYGLRFQYGGAYTSSLDDTNNYFSYMNVGHVGGSVLTGPNSEVILPYAVPIVGDDSGSGFHALTPSAAGSPAGSGGYALELPGEGELLRPNTLTVNGSNNVLHASSPMVGPAVLASSANCPSLKGNVTYQFIAMGSQFSPDLIEHAVYGSVQISGTGTAFTFSNLNMYGFSGDSLSPAALPVGNCGTTQSGYVINSTATTQFYYYPGSGGLPTTVQTTSVTLTTALSPSGLFVMDQDQGSPYLFDTMPGTTGPMGLVGVQQPASALDTGSIVSGKYLGFEYNAAEVGLGNPASNPVSFGQVAGSGTVMTGGGYANDDVTQTPAANITMNLGQQDSANNGLYKNVTATVPDTFSECLGKPFGGTDSSGNPTCTFSGVAVAGNVAGKFVIFVSLNDLSQASYFYTFVGESSAPANLSKYGTLQFFLYQQ